MGTRSTDRADRRIDKYVDSNFANRNVRAVMPTPTSKEPKMNTYNILNRAGNPLLFHAEITLTGLAKQDAPPFSEDAVAPIVWSGSMQWCSFETLEQFIVLIQDAYGAVEGNIKITDDDEVYSIHWDCDDGYIANGYKGVKAVNYVADALKSLQAEKEGIALDV